MKVYSYAVALATVLYGCGPEPLVAQKKGFRCEDDGVCVTVAKSKNLSGGFRKGNMEIGFDVAHSPSVSNALMGGAQFCSRLMLDTGHIFSSFSNTACPPGWRDSAGDMPDDENLMAQYWSLIPVMKEALAREKAPPGYLEQWQLVDLLLDPKFGDMKSSDTTDESPRIEPSQEVLDELEQRRVKKNPQS